MSTRGHIGWFESTLLRGWSKPNALSLLLLPVSLLYWLLSSLHRNIYLLGLLPRYQAPIPIVVVGNLTVGGSGKSPFVAALVNALCERGLKVGIVSRGYLRANGENSKSAVVLTQHSRSADVGDEPLMLFEQTQAPMAVGYNRRLAIEALIAQHDLDLIVCDDGLQHWKLQPTVRICIDDRSQIASNHFLLPAGPYRERRYRMAEMDEVAVHLKTEHSAVEDNPNSGKADSGQNNVGGLSTFYLEAQEVEPVAELAKANLLKEQQVNLVAGIGKPDRFFAMAHALGFSGPEHRFGDHHTFSETDLSFNNGLAVLMTEKDAVKCREFQRDDLWYLPVRAKLDPVMLKRLVDRVQR